MNQESQMNYFAVDRNGEKIGLALNDHRRHVYVLGKTGRGKTALLVTMIMNDLATGLGVCLIDPHGDLAEHVLKLIPGERQSDVVAFTATEDGQTPEFDFPSILRERKIVVVNLAKGFIGEEACQKIGQELLVRLSEAATQREVLPIEERPDFCVYIDEFQEFFTPEFAKALPDLRKYRCNLVVAQQYLEQLDPVYRPGLLNTVENYIFFSIGVSDGETFAPMLYPGDPAAQNEWVKKMSELPKFNICARLLKEGENQPPVWAETVLPPVIPE